MYIKIFYDTKTVVYSRSLKTSKAELYCDKDFLKIVLNAKEIIEH